MIHFYRFFANHTHRIIRIWPKTSFKAPGNEGVRDYIKYSNEEKVHHTFKEVPAERYLRSMNENNQYQPQILTKTESPLV
jgi:hypothetical protein